MAVSDSLSVERAMQHILRLLNTVKNTVNFVGWPWIGVDGAGLADTKKPLKSGAYLSVRTALDKYMVPEEGY